MVRTLPAVLIRQTPQTTGERLQLLPAFPQLIPIADLELEWASIALWQRDLETQRHRLRLSRCNNKGAFGKPGACFIDGDPGDERVLCDRAARVRELHHQLRCSWGSLRPPGRGRADEQLRGTTRAFRRNMRLGPPLQTAPLLRPTGPLPWRRLERSGWRPWRFRRPRRQGDSPHRWRQHFVGSP